MYNFQSSIRMQSVKAVMPLFQRFVATSPEPDEPEDNLLSAPTPHEAKVVAYYTTVLKYVSMPRNSKLFAMLPETAAHGHLLPLTGHAATDARLLRQVLAHEEAGPLLQRLLEWQNKLRVMLRKLMSLRSDDRTVSSMHRNALQQDGHDA